MNGFCCFYAHTLNPHRAWGDKSVALISVEQRFWSWNRLGFRSVSFTSSLKIMRRKQFAHQGRWAITGYVKPGDVGVWLQAWCGIIMNNSEEKITPLYAWEFSLGSSYKNIYHEDIGHDLARIYSWAGTVVEVRSSFLVYGRVNCLHFNNSIVGHGY